MIELKDDRPRARATRIANFTHSEAVSVLSDSSVEEGDVAVRVVAAESVMRVAASNRDTWAPTEAASPIVEDRLNRFRAPDAKCDQTLPTTAMLTGFPVSSTPYKRFCGCETPSETRGCDYYGMFELSVCYELSRWRCVQGHDKEKLLCMRLSRK